MDELACPDRVRDGVLMCVDCCAITDYITDDTDIYGCGVGHHDMVVFDKAEWQNIAQANWENTRVDQTAREAFNDAMIRDWLLEIYTAFAGQAKQPKVAEVAATIYDVPGSYGGQRDLVGDLMSDPDDMTNAQAAQIMKLLDSHGIPTNDWHLRDIWSPFLVVINRRPI